MFVLYFQPLHRGEELSIQFWHSPFLISLHSLWDASDTPSLSSPAPRHPLTPRILMGSKILSPSSFFLHIQLNYLQPSLRTSSSPTYAKATYQSLLSCFGCFKFQCQKPYQAGLKSTSVVTWVCSWGYYHHPRAWVHQGLIVSFLPARGDCSQCHMVTSHLTPVFLCFYQDPS